MKIRIHRLSPDVALPSYASPGAAAFDLVANETVTIAPGAVGLVGTGLVVEIPPGYFLAVFARSSLPLRRQLLVANGVGVVDPDYRGPADEVRVLLINVSTSPVEVTRGERIAQGMVLAAPRVEWEDAGPPEGPSRGGFGATGGYTG